MREATETATVEPVLLRVEEAAQVRGIGRAMTCALGGQGELEVVRISRATRVPIAALC
jgi:hypothetical protein